MEMIYHSTRGADSVSAATAIKKGLASDGGLYMPESFPKINESFLKMLCQDDYPTRAAKLLSLYLTDYDYDKLLADCKAAYGDRFTDKVAPITKLGDRLRVLELWHGPTCAFKDMALQIMPRLLSRSLEITGEDKDALILVATSGDTGKAALEGYRDVPRTKIQVFYPENGVSRAQKKQMQTQEGENVSVIAIKGNFDDAQSGVKRIFSDTAFSKELESKGIFLSSANSINWGRLVPQLVYYVSSYCDMLTDGDIQMGDIVDVCVPTGNFGNILAAYIAKRMGLPIGRLICASNDNKVLADFLSSGVYDRNRPFHATISPSMDILISSNLERLLYLAAGREKCASYMKSLVETGAYTVDPQVLTSIQSDFAGLWCDERGCMDEIASVYRRFGYLIDTHTAVALSCAEKYAETSRTTDRKILVASTASPYKFAPAVCTALSISAKGSDAEIFERLSAYTKTEIPAPLAAVLEKGNRFNTIIEAESMKDAVRTFTAPSV